jgi:hypothetical protein
MRGKAGFTWFRLHHLRTRLHHLRTVRHHDRIGRPGNLARAVPSLIANRRSPLTHFFGLHEHVEHMPPEG